MLNELSLNESLHYKEKVSKYLKTTLRCISDPMFWFFMTSGHNLRSPLLHFYAVLCCRDSKVVEVINNKLYELAAEFSDLLSGFASHITKAMEFISETPEPGKIQNIQRNVTDWITGSLAILLHNAGSFDRRVINHFTRLLPLV